MSDEMEQARKQLAQARERTDKRSKDARDLASWFRRQQAENGWRVVIEQIVKGT